MLSKKQLHDKHFINFQLMLTLLFTYIFRHFTSAIIKLYDPIYSLEINELEILEKKFSYSRSDINNFYEQKNVEKAHTHTKEV